MYEVPFRPCCLFIEDAVEGAEDALGEKLRLPLLLLDLYPEGEHITVK